MIADGALGASSDSSGSFSVSTDLLYLLVVYSQRTSAQPAVPTVTDTGGRGMTWTQVDTIAFGFARLTIFRSVPTSSGTGSFDVTFAGVTQSGISWGLMSQSQVHLTNNGADAIVQTATATAESATSVQATLGAFQSSLNGTLFGVGATTDQNVVAEAGYVEITELGWDFTDKGIHSSGFYSAPDTTPSASGSLANWCIIGVELRASIVEAPLTIVPGGLTAPATVPSPAAYHLVEAQAVSDSSTVETPLLYHTVAADAVADPETLLSPSAAHIIEAQSVADPATLLSPSLYHTIESQAVSGAAALLTPSLYHLVVADVVVASSTLLDPTITAGAFTVVVDTLVASTTVFDPTAQPGAVIVVVDALSTAESVQSPVVYYVIPSPLVSTSEAANAPNLYYVIEASVVAGPATVLDPTVTQAQLVVVPVLASPAMPGEPTLYHIVVAQVVAGPASLFTPTVQPGLVTVVAQTIVDAEAVQSPVLLQYITVARLDPARVQPDGIVASTGLSGTISDVQDTVDAINDTTWVTASMLRVSFNTPGSTPEGVQRFRIRVRPNG